MKKKIHFIIFLVIIIPALSVCSRSKNNTETPASTAQTYISADEYEGGPGDDYEALPPGFGYPYSAILEGDLSNWAGTWVNGNSERRQLKADGVFAGDSTDSLKADGFSMYEYGAYYWGVRAADGYGGYGVMLYPPGVQINIFGMSGNELIIVDTIQTDITKVRITAGHEAPNSGGEVFYLESEIPAAVSSAGSFAGSSGPYPQIINGDLSFFAGKWENGDGNIRTLASTGIFGSGYAVRDFIRTGAGVYTWQVSGGGDSFEVRLYPAGIEVVTWDDQIILTDTSKIRIAVYAQSSDEVYYREGELPAGNDSGSADLSGQWRFESGDLIWFFAQGERKSSNPMIPFADFYPDHVLEIWEIIPGESYLSGGRSVSAKGNWVVIGDSTLMVIHESAVEGAYYFSFTLRGDVLSITDQYGDTAVYQRVYLQ